VGSGIGLPEIRLYFGETNGDRALGAAVPEHRSEQQRGYFEGLRVEELPVERRPLVQKSLAPLVTNRIAAITNSTPATPKTLHITIFWVRFCSGFSGRLSLLRVIARPPGEIECGG